MPTDEPGATGEADESLFPQTVFFPGAGFGRVPDGSRQESSPAPQGPSWVRNGQQLTPDVVAQSLGSSLRVADARAELVSELIKEVVSASARQASTQDVSWAYAQGAVAVPGSTAVRFCARTAVALCSVMWVAGAADVETRNFVNAVFRGLQEAGRTDPDVAWAVTAVLGECVSDIFACARRLGRLFGESSADLGLWIGRDGGGDDDRGVSLLRSPGEVLSRITGMRASDVVDLAIVCGNVNDMVRALSRAGDPSTIGEGVAALKAVVGCARALNGANFMSTQLRTTSSGDLIIAAVGSAIQKFVRPGPLFDALAKALGPGDPVIPTATHQGQGLGGVS